MGIWNDVKSFFSAGDADEAADLALPAGAIPPIPAPVVAPVVANDETAAAPQELRASRVNKILRATLAKQDVKYYDANGKELIAKFKAGDVTLKSSGYTYVPQSEETIPHGQSVTFSVALPAGVAVSDMDLVSANTAMVNVLKAIPELGQHIFAKPFHAAPQTFEDVIDKELVPALEAKNDPALAADIALAKQFSKAHAGKADTASTWDKAIRASHPDGKVVFNIDVRELPTDEGTKLSSDKVITEGFTSKKDEIKRQVIKEAVATGVLSAEDVAKLDDLELHIVESGWNITAEFTTKLATTKDANGHDLLPEELAKKKATPLANIKTEELEKILSGVLLTTSKELAPRFLDAPMLASHLLNITHNDPAVTKVIMNHEMFKSEDHLKMQHEDAAKHHGILLEQANIEYHEGVPHLEMTFPLREHETLDQVLQRIVGAQHVIQAGAKPPVSHAAAVTAANDQQVSAAAAVA